jgi:Ni,Fe-hydrogenase III large subunit
MYDEPKLRAAGIHQGIQSNSQLDTQRNPSEIEGCLNRMDDALSRLTVRMDALADRLRPVTRATGAVKERSNGAPQEALSSLGETIRMIQQRVDGECDRLESLLIGLAI